MSQEDIEVVRRATDAFNRRDRAGWLALCDPAYETVPSPDWPETDPIRGREAAWDFYVEVDESWLPGPYEVVHMADADDRRIVGHLRREMRGKVSGADVTYDYWLVCTVSDGKIRRAEWFEDERQALAAAGLRD